MKTKAETIHIPYTYGDTIKIKPVSDVHLGSRHCDLKALRAYLGEPDSKTYLIGLGDMMDCIIVSDTKRYRKSGDAIESDDIINASVDQWVDMLTPFKAQIIGLGIGNHEDTIVKRCSVNPIKLLCDRLTVPYLGYSFLLRLNFREEQGRGRTVIIRGHHGWGGGSRTQGADLTKFSRDVAQFDADLFLYGHVHRLQYDTVPRLSLVGDVLTARDKHLIICGTFLKTYSGSTDVTYAESAGYPPAKIGGAIINIKPSTPWVDISVAV
uniref:Putative calcineurin-like phosphoesterase n=1 Tax=viral metagenome TaxID=1070528 RepID=A0A6M3JL23_9ZZZZ